MIRYIIVLFLVCFAFARVNSAPLQTYDRHVVEEGDTMYKLTNLYNVTAVQLLDLNPDLKLGLKKGATILIPKSLASITDRPIVSYETHKVRRKETLYTLSRLYGVTELDLKEANKELYSKPLRKGSEIRVPVFKRVEVANVEDIKILPGVTEIKKVASADVGKGEYKVKKSEGKYRVATSNNISIAQLEQWNPGLGELKEGMIVNVTDPTIKKNSDDVDLRYIKYEVEPKMTMYRLEKMSGLKSDSLIAINPSLIDGVKAGMVINLPYRTVSEKKAPELWSSTARYARLVDSITNYKNQKMAVMLPLSISTISKDTYGNHLKSDNNKLVRVAIDFYSGMMVARDSARALGITVQYDVYDTGNSESNSLKIIRENDFSVYNSVIGPLKAKNVVAVTKELRDKDIPVVSPLTNTNVKLFKNLFQARPDQEFLMNRLKKYIVDFAQGKNVIIVTDNQNPKYKEEFAPLFPNPNILFPDKNNYISNAKYNSVLSKELENVIVMAVDDRSFFSGAVPNYAAKARTYDITMIGMDDYDDMNLNNMNLAAVNYTYPKMNRNTVSENVFAAHYFNKHGITPSEVATRGFDVAMDVILRQASADNLYESAVRNGKTVMVENSFVYNKRFLAGFYNEACYILRYKPDLSIEEVPVYEN